MIPAVSVDVDRPKEKILSARVQAAKLVAICVTAYPGSDKYQTEQAVNNTVNLWAGNFIDDDWSIVAMALTKHISISKWPPSIAEIREIMTEILNPDLITPDEAWEIVSKNIDTDSGWEDAECCFPLPIIRAVNMVGYANLRDMRKNRRNYSGNKNAGLDRIAFEKAYTPEYEREKQTAQLPRHLKEALEQAKYAFAGESRRLYTETQKRLEKRDREKTDLMRYVLNDIELEALA
jgi:hypothetical protein